MNFLICTSDEHADFVDHLIMDRLREVDNAKGASWSGVYYEAATDRYAVLWGSPVSDLFGPADLDPSLVVVEGEMIQRNAQGEIVAGTWERYEPPAPEPMEGMLT